jgi:hypothetical protein
MTSKSPNAHDSDHELTRRQLLQTLPVALTAASVMAGSVPIDAQGADANAKVRATLDELVRDTPEIGLQVAAYLCKRRPFPARVAS